jgi:hypothetical protein
MWRDRERFALEWKSIYGHLMSVQELESEIKRLSPSELAIFSRWFDEYSSESMEQRERSSWRAFSAQGLAGAYSNSEPEYTAADIKP